MIQAAPTREVLWNVSNVWLMYVLFAISMAIAGYGIWRRVSAWRRGLPADRFDRPKERLRLLLKHALGQRRTVREKYAAVFHTLIYTGFIVLTIATTVVAVHHDFGLPVMQGAFYLYFQSFTVDVFGALLLIGVGIAMWRRWSLRPKKLVYTDEAELILAAIFLIALTGFLLEGWRIAATSDPWGTWSPVGYLVAMASKPLMGAGALKLFHFLVWWTHAVLVFGFIAAAPYTKMIHVLTGPLNIYTARLTPIGASLKPMDFDKLAESGEPMGVKTLAGFTWKDLADFDACTECGRCTAVCPAHAVGKELSPRDIILDLQSFARSGDGAFAASVIGAVPATSPDALWQCTTCGACMEACPVFIEQMPKIVDMRRYLVMEEAEFPDSM
ncbi:MAG: (Fe-S)-binding protein, partial [Blastocatellia bacterium]